MLVVVIVAVIGGVFAYNGLRPNENKPAQGAPPVVEVVPTTPTTPTSTVRTPTVDLAHPFLNTPMAGWPDGEVGLVIPPATAVNGFSADKVAKAVDQTRAAVVAGHLDRRVIQDGNVDILAALFAPDAQKYIRDDNGQLRLRIKPGFRLLDVPPKVTGSLSVTAGKEGELVIRANYEIAYAFDTDNPGRLRDPNDIVSVTRYDEQYRYFGDKYAKSGQGLWSGEAKSFWMSVACGPVKENLLAPAYSERNYDLPGGPTTSGLLDLNAPMPTGGNCPS